MKPATQALIPNDRTQKPDWLSNNMNNHEEIRMESLRTSESN